MKKLVLIISLLVMLAGCNSKTALNLDHCTSLKLSYTIGGPMVIVEGEDLNKVVAILEEYYEISADDHEDSSSLKAINVASDKDEGGLLIMVYPDSSAVITDPENNSPKDVQFSDDTYETLAQYIDYDFDDIDLGSE